MTDIKHFESWILENEIKSFVYNSKKWKINHFKNLYGYKNPESSKNGLPYFGVLNREVYFIINNYLLFKSQLEEKIGNSKNTLAIETKLKHTYLKNIQEYNSWYNKNKKKFTLEFCPYTIMKNRLTLIKEDILEYFPHLENDLKK